METGEIAHNEQFLLSQSVFHPFRELPAIFIKFEIFVRKPFQFGRVLNLLFGKWLTHSRTSPGFLHVYSISLLKTPQKKRNFSFSPVFSTILENILPLSSNLKLLPADSLSMEESKICRLGKG